MSYLVTGELAKEVKKENEMHFGLYHSLYEWFNPLYLDDKASNFTQQNFVNNKIIPEMKELVKNYKSLTILHTSNKLTVMA